MQTAACRRRRRWRRRRRPREQHACPSPSGPAGSRTRADGWKEGRMEQPSRRQRRPFALRQTVGKRNARQQRKERGREREREGEWGRSVCLSRRPRPVGDTNLRSSARLSRRRAGCCGRRAKEDGGREGGGHRQAGRKRGLILVRTLLRARIITRYPWRRSLASPNGRTQRTNGTERWVLIERLFLFLLRGITDSNGHLSFVFAVPLPASASVVASAVHFTNTFVSISIWSGLKGRLQCNAA